MTRQIQDQTFKKMLDSISPTSQNTKKLCVRLGYDANDLIYKSIDEFSSFSPEMQLKKYEHYKNRVLSNLPSISQKLSMKYQHPNQGINQISPLNKLLQPKFKIRSKYLTYPSSNSQSPESSVSISMRKVKQWQSRQKVLQNLIFQQLQEEKKHVEYLNRQKKRDSEQGNHQIKKSNSNFRVKQQSKQHEQDEERRNQYFLTAIENDSRIQEQKSSRFKVKDTHSERAYSRRQQKAIDEEKDISERLQTIYQKENQAKQKVDMFRNDLKSYFAQKHNQMLSKKERRNQLLESQQQVYINEQIEKMKKFTDKKTQIISEEKKMIQEKKQKYQQMKSKCLKNMDQLNYRFQEGYNQTYQQLIEKQTKVLTNKQMLLEQKSLLLKDKLALRLEDIEFNRAHALRLKQNSEQRVPKDTKSQQSNRTMDTLRLKNQLIQKESENQIWEKAKQAASLFNNPIEYEQFIEQQQQIIMKKKKHLDQKFASAVSVIKEILPQNEANYLLMPPENKDLKLQLSRAKTSK